MILSNSSEEQILGELIEDIQYVKKQAKKLADRTLREIQKSGAFVREDDARSKYLISKNYNKWFVSIVINQTRRIPWYYYACCIVEGEGRTKDYYLLRGHSSNQPYYIKLTTHAVKRFVERNNFDGAGILEVYASGVFAHREIGICQRFIDFKYEAILMNVDDTHEISDMSYFVLCSRGVFYANRTQQGNYLFKTYISIEMALDEMKNIMKGKSTKWEKEGRFLYYLIDVHQYYNKWLYDEEALEHFLYKDFGRNVEFTHADNSAIYLLKY